MATLPDEIQPDDEREFDIDPKPEGETPEGDVEIDVDGEDEADPEPEVAKEPEPEPKQEDEPKPRRRADERVAALARRVAEAEARALEAERRAAEREQQLAESQSVNVGAMENALKSELQGVKRELIEAKTLGDYAAEVEATAKLTKLSADLSAIEAYKASQRQPEQRQQEQKPAATPQAPQTAPETAAWLTANTWFTPGNDDYDEEMAIDAKAFAQKLEARLKREGKANEIGSREYFTLIDEHISQLYPDEVAPKPKSGMPAMKADKTVAPVARQSAPAQQPKKAGVIRLSSEQRSMAERINPHLPAKEAWAVYARNM